MGDDGIIGEIADVAGGVVAAVGDELKKFGKSAASQVTGSQASPQKTAQPSAGSTGGDDAASAIVGEFKKLAHTVGSQVTGSEPTFDGSQLAKMAKKDEEFYAQEAAAILAKINRVYQEYAVKRAREQQQRQIEEQRRDKEKKEVVRLQKNEKQEGMDVAVAQAKARAEIKNYGAE